jgi:glycosyltransferase involved in cell wall biosynthesis
MPKYVIVTPAHNEADFIERTIVSMQAQTVRPLRWVIVNDASTDATGEIVRGYCERNSFMRLVNVERPAGRHFGNKAQAFKRGQAQVRDEKHAYIGNLDADISLEPNYYENILREFDKDPKLGIAGGIVFTKIGNQFVTSDRALDSVAGAVQLFRRECFDQIGGYPVLSQGGIDAAAEITARMKGWKVQKLPEHRVLEYRRTGTAAMGPLKSRMKEGRHYHSLGYGALFYFLRCVYRVRDRPVIMGSVAGLAGYLEGVLRRQPVVLPPETVRYLRGEQREKLKRLLPLAGWRQVST